MKMWSWHHVRGAYLVWDGLKNLNRHKKAKGKISKECLRIGFFLAFFSVIYESTNQKTQTAHKFRIADARCLLQSRPIYWPFASSRLTKGGPH